MVFFAALFSYLIERFLHWKQLRQWGWFYSYQNWLNRWVTKKTGSLSPVYTLAIYVLPLGILIGIVSLFLSVWWHGILHVIFGMAVLLYCLGPSNLWAQVYECLTDMQKGDAKKALEDARTAFGISAPDNSQVFHQSLVKALFVEANKRVFAVFFWFGIFGPMGAFIYRGVERCESVSSVAEAAVKAHQMLDWLPVRFFSFLFALTGNFTKVFAAWRSAMMNNTLDANDTIIVECGSAALTTLSEKKIPENGDAEREALQLFDRTLIMTLGILAIIVLFV